MSWGIPLGLFHFFPYVRKEAQKERKGIQEKKEGQKWGWNGFCFLLGYWGSAAGILVITRLASQVSPGCMYRH